MKEGLLEDADNREALLDLLLLDSTHDTAAPTTLRGYRERMKPGQNRRPGNAGAAQCPRAERRTALRPRRARLRRRDRRPRPLQPADRRPPRRHTLKGR
nr:hypothetical protein [Actinospica robiniae]